ncbi:MAG TPA: ribosome recycling factor [bacterium]|nr:ribosome recycling factor [bacterium]HQO35779.1 ribosome recycling factor [bacterium]HQP99142.1 ribosome recycling factor [bacterium]
MSQDYLDDTELRMEEAVEACRQEMARLRTGRASAALLDGVSVEAYGTRTPLRQLANVSVPEARLIVVQPYDKSIIGDIERAINKSDLGLTPNSDGKLIRLSIPPLTEERRKDLAKVVKKLAEEGKVHIRGIRREANDDLKKAEKDGDIPEDDARKMQDRVQELTNQFIEKIDNALEDKEKEIMNF